MKTMKHATLIAVPALLLSSVTAMAATDLDAIKACSLEIATAIENEQGAALKLNIDKSGFNERRRLKGITVFHIDAKDPSTNNVVGKFDCRVNRRAEVRSLRELSPGAPIAERRSRS